MSNYNFMMSNYNFTMSNGYRKHCNVKSHRGRGPIRPAWYLCIVDTITQSSIGFATMIPSRKATTMVPIIERIVRPGRFIHTNEAKACKLLKDCSHGYEHLSVCHKYNFVDPVTGIHTQNVES